jgi:hypothetical protein
LFEISALSKKEFFCASRDPAFPLNPSKPWPVHSDRWPFHAKRADAPSDDHGVNGF